MITCTESFLQNQAASAVLQGYLFSPIARPSCPFEEHAVFNQVGWGFSPDQSLLSKGGGGGGELVLTPLQPLAHAHPRGENKGVMDNSFEARLGLVPQVEKAVVVSEAQTDGMEGSHGKQPPRSSVLVVMDANKELSVNAIEWALTFAVQKGDTVKLLGVLQHIMNPSMSISRASCISWFLTFVYVLTLCLDPWISSSKGDGREITCLFVCGSASFCSMHFPLTCGM